MNNKQLARLAGVLVVALVLWGGFAFARHARRDTADGFVLPKVDTAAVDTIAFTQHGDSAVLVRHAAGHWRVNGFPAAPVPVDQLLRALVDTSNWSELAAEQRSSQAAMGVAADSGRNVRVVAKGGGAASGDGGFDERRRRHVRASRGRQVTYALHGPLAQALAHGLGDWRDKTIASIPPDSVQRVEVTHGREAYTVRRKGRGWVLGTGAAADSNAVQRLLGQLHPAIAMGFATAAVADSAHFTRPTARVRVFGAGASPLVTLLFDRPPRTSWCGPTREHRVHRGGLDAAQDDADRQVAEGVHAQGRVAAAVAPRPARTAAPCRRRRVAPCLGALSAAPSLPKEPPHVHEPPQFPQVVRRRRRRHRPRRVARPRARRRPGARAARPTASPERAPSPLDILIIGGTGFTGPEQVNYALARGHRVTLFNRNKTRPNFFKGRVTELIGDLSSDTSALDGKQFDVVIDNPTTAPIWVRNVAKYMAGHTKHYIFISTLSVYPDNSHPGADETDGLTPMPDGLDPFAVPAADARKYYGALKTYCEGFVQSTYPGITTIIRPGLIVGPLDRTDRFTYWPARIDRGGEVLAPGEPNWPVQFIDARDLAEWTIRMAENRTFGMYNAMGPGARLSMAEMLYGIKAITTAGAQFTWVPADFLREQKISAWRDMPVWVPATGPLRASCSAAMRGRSPPG